MTSFSRFFFSTVVFIGFTSVGHSMMCETSPYSRMHRGNPVGAKSVDPNNEYKPGWNLIWSDEFDGTELDLEKWWVRTTIDVTNNELQFYTDDPKNYRLENGHLVITARKEKKNGFDYTSARLTTQGKRSWKYGRFEIRAKLPKGQGMWPAVWMMPKDEVYGRWPLSGEIDIVETTGRELNRNYGTIHYGPEWPNNQMTGAYYELDQGDFSDDFHVFVLEWKPFSLRWLVDGVEYSFKVPTDLGPVYYPWIFNEPFYFIVNLAVGGHWPGPPDHTTVFPQSMLVDYIRVYEED